jgi:ribosome-associated toxin RatA of RatAB toxin-antitoxin module
LGTGALVEERARPLELGPMPLGRPMVTIDEQLVRSSLDTIFELARNVEEWPRHLPHYRYVRFRDRRPDGGGIVEMSANRPFPLPLTPLHLNWPTWWRSEMSVNDATRSIRFRHIAGVTKGMDVEWSFSPTPEGIHVRILHLWNGPAVPVVGIWAAVHVIGPVFIHGIASRTLSGLASVAQSQTHQQQ